MVKSLGKVNYFSSDSAFWQALTFAFAARGKFSFCARILKFFFLAPLQTKKETYFKIQLVNSATAAGSTLACFFCYRITTLWVTFIGFCPIFCLLLPHPTFFFFFFCYNNFNKRTINLFYLDSQKKKKKNLFYLTYSFYPQYF